ncbi:hypothetical protein [Streptomyces chartreusis]|uniref:hypothetical protein n=1 Tax=Streptomyces chartreusis TaxID=1969 RepID=UPI00123DE31F|nr:hypothetical protein [Streptomyces chartreusis]QEV66254.1 hypothetical protein CP983_05960 [Streptomyces chartreusis]GGW98994.1 hypothetical protein GCM10010321_11820 [Streptomyces chartreusis]
MTRPVGKRERPDEVSWLLQIQHKPRDPWHDHTGNLFGRKRAEAFLAERRATNPTCRYRLVRVTTAYTIAADW